MSTINDTHLQFILNRIEEEISFKPAVEDFDVDFNDLGLDSLDMHVVLHDFQEKFNIDIQYDDIAKMNTINSLLEIIQKHEANKPS